jgi:hypothetical protein
MLKKHRKNKNAVIPYQSIKGILWKWEMPKVGKILPLKNY